MAHRNRSRSDARRRATCTWTWRTWADQKAVGLADPLADGLPHGRAALALLAWAGLASGLIVALWAEPRHRDESATACPAGQCDERG